VHHYETLLKVVIGSQLYGYDTEDSDKDYRSVHIIPLADRLHPLGFKRLYKEEDKVQKIENLDLEFSEFVKKLWESDINAWETLFSHDVVVDSRSAQLLRDCSSLFLREDGLQTAAYKMGSYFIEKAAENPKHPKAAKHAVHAYKTALFVYNVLEHEEYPTKLFVDELQLLRDMRKGYANKAYDFTEIVQRKLADVFEHPVSSKREVMSDGALTYVMEEYIQRA
jgi:predicted nucleotidyltransferase